MDPNAEQGKNDNPDEHKKGEIPRRGFLKLLGGTLAAALADKFLPEGVPTSHAQGLPAPENAPLNEIAPGDMIIIDMNGKSIPVASLLDVRTEPGFSQFEEPPFNHLGERVEGISPVYKRIQESAGRRNTKISDDLMVTLPEEIHWMTMHSGGYNHEPLPGDTFQEQANAMNPGDLITITDRTTGEKILLRFVQELILDVSEAIIRPGDPPPTVNKDFAYNDIDLLGYADALQHTEYVFQTCYPPFVDSEHGLTGLNLMLVLAERVPSEGPYNPGITSYNFAETNHTVSGEFLTQWRRAGLEVNGYPISDVYNYRAPDGNTYKVQDFERGRFELHDENEEPNRVLGSLYGVQKLKEIHNTENLNKTEQNTEAAYYCEETQHNVGLEIRRYWYHHGGLAQFGYPISEELEEVCSDGNIHTVQYFERVRFEHHPDGIKMSLLGVEYQGKR